MDDFVDDIFYTPQSYDVPHEVENAPRSSTNRSRKRKNKERTIDRMCSSIGTMAETVAAMVPQLNELVNVLSTADKDVADLQVKLYDEKMAIEGLIEDEIYDATNVGREA